MTPGTTKYERAATAINVPEWIPEHCIGCNQCVPHCPQNIRIPQELHRIDRFAEHLKQDNL